MESLDPELGALAEAGQFEALEERWLERIEAAPADAGFFVGMLRLLLRARQAARATTLLQFLLEALHDRGDAAAELAFVRPALRTWPQSPELRTALFDALRRAYADRPSLEQLLVRFKLAEAVEPQAALEALEAWLRFDVGRAVLMQGRGLGRVVEINVPLATLRVDFAADQRLSLRLAEAQKLLTPLEPGHFLLERLARPAELQALAEADPGAVLEKVFASLRRPLGLGELREALAGVVPQERWAAWWKRASADPRLATSGGNRPTYSWSDSGRAAEDVVLALFDAAAGRSKLDLARKHAARSPALAETLARGVARLARDACATDPSLALEALLTLERLPHRPEVDPGCTPAGLLDAADPVPVVAGVEERTLRERGLQMLRERRADWPELYARLLRAETDTRTLGLLYDALQRDGGSVPLARAVDDVLARPHTAPRFFVWLCRELRRRPELDPRGDWGLLRRLLDAHTQEAFRSVRVPLRELCDAGGIAEHLAERLTLEQAGQLHLALGRELGLDEHRKDHLRLAVLRCHPELGAAEEEVLYATPEALERQRGEFERITRVDIPRNAEEIRKAAAHGDLSENFEYKAARDRHEMLSSRAKTLHDELRRARVLDPSHIDASRVRIGTRVTLSPVADGEPRSLTILGPWDSDPAGGIVSYLAPAVQPLLGKSPGDTVQFLDGSFVVAAIAVWREA